jgi:hypothetical protein
VVLIPLSERGDWYSIIRERGLGFHYQRERVGIPVTDLTLPPFLYLSQARTWISNAKCCHFCNQWLFFLLILSRNLLSYNLFIWKQYYKLTCDIVSYSRSLATYISFFYSFIQMSCICTWCIRRSWKTIDR